MSDAGVVMQSVEVFERWAAAINRHDVSAMAALMTVDHEFVDSLGNAARGATLVAAGWRSYFEMCPDYWIRADAILEKDDTVLAAGEAGGTIQGEAWRTPAAWKLITCDGKIVEWRVFADNKPVYEILTRS